MTNKSAVQTWSNSRGEGKLFRLDLVDGSGEIRLTAFEEQVDKFYDYIQVFSKKIIQNSNTKITFYRLTKYIIFQNVI